MGAPRDPGPEAPLPPDLYRVKKKSVKFHKFQNSSGMYFAKLCLNLIYNLSYYSNIKCDGIFKEDFDWQKMIPLLYKMIVKCVNRK